MKIARFSKKCAKAIAELDSRVALFGKDHSSDTVHDVRTSIRRVEAALDLLPKGVRQKKKIRKYLSACKKLFKSTTPVRDSDIVFSNLLTYENDPNVQQVLAKIQNDRNHMLVSCSLCAENLSNIKVPKINKEELSLSTISKRRKKIITKIQAKMQEGLPLILRDFRKIDELHDLRKQCKILRYTLEILPSKSDEKLIGLMEEWQTLLGAIRDIDVTENFINETGLSEELEAVIVNLKISRDGTLRSFVRSAKTDGIFIPSN
ncbi:MAG TPA: CHAD domain-containing protein [Nitrososphaerales archaeon]|nr:CHAD domain-containing protein [Nitrososphaerales archaeon]